MDTIELWSGSTKALISTQGAWLTNLSDQYGDVLFPKRRITNANGETKDRGGCHVCLPNFGPGGDSGLPQHGFGRAMTWGIEEQSANMVRLKLFGGPVGYTALESTLEYIVGDAQLTMGLSVRNKGTEQLRIAPAFHPYFATGNDVSVNIDDKIHILDQLDLMSLIPDVRHITINQRTITLQSSGVTEWALWSDRLAPYVCVEPTVAGESFIAPEQSVDGVLEAGEMKTLSLTISWK